MRRKVMVCAWGVLFQGPTVFDSAGRGDVVGVRRFLDAGGDANSREAKTSIPSFERNDPGGKKHFGNTLLIKAVESRTLGLVSLLLSRKADPNRRGEHGTVPLISAASRQVPDIVRLLLRSGADPNLRNDAGDTAIVFAANSGDLKAIDMLLRRGANINGGTGWTPLMDAAYNGRAEVAQLLLRRGADVNYHPTGLMSPFECAVAQSNDGMVRMLKKRGAKGEVRMVKATMDAERAKAERAFKTKDGKAAVSAATAEDGELIELAAAALLNDPTVPDSIARSAELALFSKSNGLDYSLDNRINGGDTSRSFDVSLEIRQDYARRNQGVSDLTGIKFQRGRLRLETQPPRMRRGQPYVTVWLPGYSKARDRALVCFTFGPTHHGASGSVFLMRVNDRWIVDWCRLSYYV